MQDAAPVATLIPRRPLCEVGKTSGQRWLPPQPGAVWLQATPRLDAGHPPCDDLREIPAAGGALTSAPVDTEGFVGEDCSLAVDAGGGVHISDRGYMALRYAHKPAGGVFDIASIDTSGDVGLFTSLAVDATGDVHISYQDASNDVLKYALRPCA